MNVQGCSKAATCSTGTREDAVSSQVATLLTLAGQSLFFGMVCGPNDAVVRDPSLSDSGGPHL